MKDLRRFVSSAKRNPESFSDELRIMPHAKIPTDDLSSVSIKHCCQINEFAVWLRQVSEVLADFLFLIERVAIAKAIVRDPSLIGLVYNRFNKKILMAIGTR